MKNFRVYKITDKKTRQAIGNWQDGNGKVYHDNINFLYYKTLKNARIKSVKILNTTSERCIAIESIYPRVLYLIDKQKTEILSSYNKVNIKHKYLYKNLKHKINYTIEKTKKGIYAYTYNHEKFNNPIIKEEPKPSGNIYFDGQLIEG